MKSMNDLNRLIELFVRHRLPREQTLFMEIEEYNKAMDFLKNLGSGATASVALQGSNPEIETATLNYNGYIIHFVMY